MHFPTCMIRHASRSHKMLACKIRSNKGTTPGSNSPGPAYIRPQKESVSLGRCWRRVPGTYRRREQGYCFARLCAITSPGCVHPAWRSTYALLMLRVCVCMQHISCVHESNKGCGGMAGWCSSSDDGSACHLLPMPQNKFCFGEGRQCCTHTLCMVELCTSACAAAQLMDHKQAGRGCSGKLGRVPVRAELTSYMRGPAHCLAALAQPLQACSRLHHGGPMPMHAGPAEAVPTEPKRGAGARTQRVSSGVQASGRASRCRPACLCVLHQLSSSKTISHSSNRQNECGRLCRLHDRAPAYLQHSRRTAAAALQP